jgi:hypothetical protein
MDAVFRAGPHSAPVPGQHRFISMEFRSVVSEDGKETGEYSGKLARQGAGRSQAAAFPVHALCHESGFAWPGWCFMANQDDKRHPKIGFSNRRQAILLSH